MSEDDPFGRKGEGETDAFGNPIAPRPETAYRAVEVPRPTHHGFTPPTDAPPPLDARPGPAGAPADWLARAGAAIVDLLIRIAIVGVGVLVGALGYLGSDAAGEAGLGIGMLLGFLASWAYAPWMIATRNGQTVGHKATGTRVARNDGAPLTGGAAVVREVLVKGLLFDTLLLWLSLGIGSLLNYLWPLWDAKNEALHDKMCNSRVIKT